jgi:hypothetical protein
MQDATDDERDRINKLRGEIAKLINDLKTSSNFKFVDSESANNLSVQISEYRRRNSRAEG